VAALLRHIIMIIGINIARKRRRGGGGVTAWRRSGVAFSCDVMACGGVVTFKSGEAAWRSGEVVYCYHCVVFSISSSGMCGIAHHGGA